MQRLDDFMNNALARYYDSRDPLGLEGDFTTAPEISQLFGEIIGIWAAQRWMEMATPSPFNLIELGPGRGTLMADFLRGTKHISSFHDAMKIHLVETSTTLRSKQENLLSGYDIQHHYHLSEIPKDVPAIIIANEFLDALPIRQFKYDGHNWHEHFVDDGQSTWIKYKSNPPSKPGLADPQAGDIYEYSQDQENYLKLIKTYNGPKLIIDYGYEHSAYGDSLQALHKHQPCAINDHIGEADLTTHVDFEWLSSFFDHTIIKTQAQFLQDNGISIRYHQLNNPNLRTGYERLLHPNQMGTLFKTLEVLL